MPDQDNIPKYLALLKRHGWTEEKAHEFLHTRVGTRQLIIPGTYLLEVLQDVCKEGIPTGQVPVSFLVPEGNWENFAKVAAAASARNGGFLLTSAEKAAMLSSDPDVQH